MTFSRTVLAVVAPLALVLVFGNSLVGFAQQSDNGKPSVNRVGHFVITVSGIT